MGRIRTPVYTPVSTTIWGVGGIEDLTEHRNEAGSLAFFYLYTRVSFSLTVEEQAMRNIAEKEKKS
jgi:hypothetical protein